MRYGMIEEEDEQGYPFKIMDSYEGYVVAKFRDKKLCESVILDLNYQD